MTEADQPDKRLGKVKALLLMGSVAASLLGAKLLANQDAPAPGTVEGSSVTIAVPAEASNFTADGNQPLLLDLNIKALPTIVAPNPIRPVARSRSSR